MGCLLRFLLFFLLLLVLVIGARRLFERPAAIVPPSAGERDTNVGQVRWRSREADGPRALPVLYVHGFLSSSATWKKVLRTASAGHPGIAVDLPGSGFSDRPWPYDYSAGSQALALLDFIDARGIERVVLVGNSMGGVVCLIAAAARPDRVAGIVLVDSVFPGVTVPSGFRLLRTPVVGELQLEFLARPVLELTLRRLYARPERLTPETVSDWWNPIPVPGTRRAMLAFVRTSSRGYEDLLSKIVAPTLVLWGKEDRLLPPAQGLRLASEIRNARLVILPDAGHLPQEETPEAFARALAEFLRQMPGANAARPPTTPNPGSGQ